MWVSVLSVFSMPYAIYFLVFKEAIVSLKSLKSMLSLLQIKTLYGGNELVNIKKGPFLFNIFIRAVCVVVWLLIFWQLLNWFVVPVLHLGSISLPLALGIYLVVKFILPSRNIFSIDLHKELDCDMLSSKEVYAWIIMFNVVNFINILIYLVIGYLLHWGSIK